MTITTELTIEDYYSEVCRWKSVPLKDGYFWELFTT